MRQDSLLKQPETASSNESRGGVEQRKAPRKKVLLTSKLVWGDGAYVVDCTIRDISTTGAFVTVTQGRQVPKEIYLLDLANRLAYHANVVSERSTGYGLKFIKTYPLAQITAPELRYLKRIWLASAQ